MPDYLNPTPPPVDPDAIAQATFDRIRETFPNYDPRESQLATMVIVALALRAAEIADLVPLIPRSIFRWFGANIINLPPFAGSPASASVTVYVRDDAGYTIPADTTMAIEDAEGVSHLFSFDIDIVVPAGSTSAGPVTVTALDDGVIGNGITAGTVTLVEALDYVIDVTQQGTSSGGADEEDDDDYLNRLTRRMGLAPRPVLADDFAAHAMVQFPEIYRMAAIDHYAHGTNEKQTVSSSDAIAGNATWTVAGIATSAIAWNSTAAAIQAILDAALGIGNTAVSGGPPPAAVTIEFKNGKGEQDIPAIVVNAGWTKTGGTAATVTVTTIQPGVAANATTAGRVTVGGVDSAGANLTSAKKAEVDAFLQGEREWGFVVDVIDPTRNAVDSNFSFTTSPNYDPADVKARAEQAVRDYLDPKTFGAPPNDPHGWSIQTKVYLWEVVGVLQSVLGLDRLVTLTLGLNGGAQSSADVTLNGTLPITDPGTIVGTAV